MKTFEGKTLEEVLEKACSELNVTKDRIHYVIKSEKPVEGEVDHIYVVDVYTLDEVCEFGANYLKNAIASIGIEIEVTCQVNDEGVMRLTINSQRNPILIGHNGRTLRALNDLTQLAISNHFKRRYRILLDVGDYKDKKYSQIISLARRVASEVRKQHFDIRLDPMTNDERKVIHQILENYPDVKTESVGTGERRAVVIKYVGPEEHAFKQEAYYKEVISNRFHNKNKKFKKKQNRSLDDLLHTDTDFLKEKVNNNEDEVPSENKTQVMDKSIDDLPSASITTPFVNTDALNDLDSKDEPTEEKNETVDQNEKKDENI